MPAQGTNDTDGLLQQIADGDASARGRLWQRHRSRLKQLITLRMDRRLAARVDPSDVVQDSLAEADQKLEGYLRNKPLPFYPWLRQLALERMVHLHRVHVRAQRRSIHREEPLDTGPSDPSTPALARRLAVYGSSPSGRMRKQERRRKLEEALTRLSDRDREVLVLRHLEQLTIREAAAVLGLTEAAVKARQVRALRQLRELLGDLGEELE
ncbi:MAG TPA: sigma-70 family RNA polymerase sigma factor [Gemmataceae bacterium]|jgi:RNA polymerase sigma-70 factor (ECF subfamily)|nr:sigma-70 family RNA polymerase sigma factor [Gemmataceae bacterium]